MFVEALDGDSEIRIEPGLLRVKGLFFFLTPKSLVCAYDVVSMCLLLGNACDGPLISL